MCAVSVWTFTLAHASLHDVLPLVQAQLAMSRLPYSERDDALQVNSTGYKMSVGLWASRVCVGGGMGEGALADASFFDSTSSVMLPSHSGALQAVRAKPTN